MESSDQKTSGRFTRYFSAGFGGEVIPIVPPGANLHPSSKIKPSQLGKIPGRYHSKTRTWTGMTDWTKRGFSLSDAKLWDQWPESNAGLRAARFPGVDLDMCSELAVDMVRLRLIKFLGWAPVRGREGSERILMPYRLAGASSAIRKASVEFRLPGVTEKQVIEFLGNGQQYVIEGAHPKGGCYSWQDAKDLVVLGAASLTEVTAEKLHDAIGLLVEKWLPEIGATDISGVGARIDDPTSYNEDDETLIAPGFDGSATMPDFERLEDAPEWFRRVASALLAIPNEERSRESWVGIAHAVKAATAGNELFYSLVFKPWCLTYCRNTEEAARELWDGIRNSRVGWLVLRGMARAHGWNDPSDTSAEAPATSIFERYVYVENVKRFFDLEVRQMLDKEQFRDRHVEYGSPTAKRNAYTAYIKDRRRRLVARPTYRPGEALIIEEAGECVVNTWRPSNLVPVEGDITAWLELIEFLIPETRERDIMLDRMAFDLQCPGEKCNWAILFGGGQGIGKDTMFQPLVAGLGLENVSYVRPSDLSDGWTDYLERKLVVVEEMANFSKKDIANMLKSLIAAPPDVVRINKKYVSQYFVPNIQSWLFFTNKQDAMALEDDDRRAFIYWSPVKEADAKKRTEGGYYRDLHRWLEENGNARVVHYLLKRDISNFNARAQAPFTTAKREMIVANRHPVEHWIRTQIEDEHGIFQRSLLTIEEIISYGQQSAPRAIQSALTSNRVAAALKSAGGRELGRTRISGQGYARIWAVRNAETHGSYGEAQLRELYLAEQEVQGNEKGPFPGFASPPPGGNDNAPHAARS